METKKKHFRMKCMSCNKTTYHRLINRNKKQYLQCKNKECKHTFQRYNKHDKKIIVNS
jgi:hypothetical protein